VSGGCRTSAAAPERQPGRARALELATPSRGRLQRPQAWPIFLWCRTLGPMDPQRAFGFHSQLRVTLWEPSGCNLPTLQSDERLQRWVQPETLATSPVFTDMHLLCTAGR